MDLVSVSFHGHIVNNEKSLPSIKRSFKKEMVKNVSHFFCHEHPIS